jgi:predicted dehydrogenase
MGRLHAQHLAASPFAELVGCCDTSPDAAERVPREVPLLVDLEEALATPGLEAVVVCTPPDAHLEAVRGALARGLEVLCEKPLAATVADCREMLELDASSTGRLVAAHLRRFDPRFLALAAEVGEGRVGAPLQLVGSSICPREDAERLAGTVSLACECGVHDIDVMRWLAGDISMVYAEGVDVHPTRGPDAFAATLRFASGVVGALQHSWAMPDESGLDWEFRFHVSGMNGIADIDGRSRGIAVLSPEGGPIYPDTVTWPVVGGQVGGVVAAQDTHFLLGVRDGRPWPLELRDAESAVACAAAIDQSIATGVPVQLQPAAA